MSRQAIFTNGLRTHFTPAFKGSLKDVRPDDLLTTLFSEQRKQFDEKTLHDVADVIVGTAYPEGEQGYNLARMCALGSGFSTPGMTINRLCASSLDAVAIAAARVRSGWGDLFLTGGVESMSRIPRRGANFSESEKIRQTSPHAYVTMGETAEILCEKTKITRSEQEDFTMRSHELSSTAQKMGYCKEHIHSALTNRDEGIKYPVDKNKISALKPCFREDGQVTAATSSPLSDGAASGWVMSYARAQQLNMKDVLIIRDAEWAHVEPQDMGMGPVAATIKLLKRNQLMPTDLAAMEMNEAFAVQTLACQKKLELPLETLNAWGGALALGHPLGASGLRLMMTLQSRLKHHEKDGALGLATLCVGGGQGLSVLCEYKSNLNERTTL